MEKYIPYVKNRLLYMKNTEINYNVPNLEKGLAIIDYLALNNKGKSLQEIKEDLDISQTTAYRILNTMVRHGYLGYNEENKNYRLTSKLLTNGFKAINENNLLETVLPYLPVLRDRVKETVCFGVLGEKKGVFIEQASGIYAFSFTLTPGKSFELHCSAPGKAIMAYLPVIVRDRYISKMEFKRYNERTITNKEDYLKELEKVFNNGYALDNEEELRGVICIGVPLFDYKGYPCGAIWISGPKDRLPDEIIKEDVSFIKDVANTISRQLGYIRNKKE